MKEKKSAVRKTFDLKPKKPLKPETDSEGNGGVNKRKPLKEFLKHLHLN